MSSAFMQSGDLSGAGFGFVVARPAKRHKVFGRVGFGYRPRNNVVNVQLLALAGKGALRAPAFTARIPVTFADCLGDFLPCASALVVLRRAALPTGAIGTGSPHNLSQNIAIVRTKSPRLAIKAAKPFSASGAFYNAGFLAAPSRAMIAGHITEQARFGVIGICLKGFTAAFTGFRDAGLWLGGLAGPRAILPPPVSRKHLAALFARFFHALNISEKRNKNKYFDIACRRVDEATRQADLFIAPPPKPVQEGLL